MAKLNSGLSSWVNQATLAFVVLCSAWHLSAPLRHAAFPLPYIEDDFFYYARIAANIAAGKGSTFDGTTPTNGYHPLYEALLVVAARCGPRPSSDAD